MHVLVAIGVLLGGGWLISHYLHPLKACTCDNGKRFGAIFRRRYRFCAACRGTNVIERPVHKFFRVTGGGGIPPNQAGPGWNDRKRRSRW